MIRRLAVVAAVGAMMCLIAGGCVSGGTEGGDVTSPIEEAEVRTDQQPLADEFPQLGGLVEAHWVGGRLGNDDVPGPSTYFIEAVVTLAPDDLARLTDRYEFTTASDTPQPPQSLTPFLDEGAVWSTSPALERSLAPPDWTAQVYVQLDRRVVYISARSQ